jgi:hypothetical protein
MELEGHRAQAKLRAVLLPDAPVLCVRISGLREGARVLSRPPDAPDLVEHFRRLGLARPQLFDLGEFGGWLQDLGSRPEHPNTRTPEHPNTHTPTHPHAHTPEHRVLCAAWLQHASPSGFLLFATVVYGADPTDARRRALQTLEAARAEGYTPASLRCFGSWRRWWDGEESTEASEGLPELLHYLRRLGVYRDQAELTVGRLGEIAVVVEGKPLGAATLRPGWLDGHALSGHRRDPRPWGQAPR